MNKDRIRLGCFCELCKKPLTMVQTTPALLKRGGGRFCYGCCMNETGAKKSKFRPGYFCKVCKAPLLKQRTKPANVKKGGGKFCSQRCRDTAVKKRSPPRYRPGYFCKLCNIPLLWERTTPSAIERGHGIFCSKKCHGLWNSENLVGHNAHNWRGGKKEHKCKVCNLPFFVGRARSKNGEGHFCSTVCMAAWQSENLTGENAPSWKGGKVSRTCEVCNTAFLIYPSVIIYNGGRFCSNICHGRWQSENLVGENSTRWMGGKSFEPYPSTFNAQFKRKIRQRDKHTCALCNKPGRSVHHINYVKEDTIPENCITLCRSCHAKTGGKRDYWKSRLVKMVTQRVNQAQQVAF